MKALLLNENYDLIYVLLLGRNTKNISMNHIPFSKAKQTSLAIITITFECIVQQKVALAPPHIRSLLLSKWEGSKNNAREGSLGLCPAAQWKPHGWGRGYLFTTAYIFLSWDICNFTSLSSDTVHFPNLKNLLKLQKQTQRYKYSENG